MTGVVTWQQIGMAVGAFLMPPLADRIGRKPVLALCLVVFGVAVVLGGVVDLDDDDGVAARVSRDLLLGDAADRAGVPFAK
jgi:MFS family permease